MESWYNVTQEDFFNNRGEGLLRRYYAGSPSTALQKIYPKHKWMPWMFKVTPMGFWTDKKNHKIFFEWLKSQLGYQQMEDWYNLTVAHVYNNGGKGLLANYYNNSPAKALQSVYPEHVWSCWIQNQTIGTTPLQLFA